MSPLVSFLLPAYKIQHLGESIESILSQSFTNFELVIVNDCSPDDIDGIVEKYQDERIRYYKNEKNIGGESLVNQWNYCLSLAQGEWTVMASDDDLYHPDYLQEMINLSKEYPFNDIFHCNMFQIDNEGNITELCAQVCEHETWLQNAYYRLTYKRTEALQDYFFRTEALIKIGGFIFFPFATFSDITTAITIAGSKGIICSSRYLFKWRNNGLNISSNPNTCKKRILSCEKMYEWIMNYYIKNNIYMDDDVSQWIKVRFSEDIRQHTLMAEMQMVQMMPTNDLKSLIKLKNWPYKLLERSYVRRNRLIRIKRDILHQ